MKIDTEGLKALYRDHVRSRVPPSREGCPAPERLVEMLRGVGGEDEKTRVVDHISRCGECARELDFLLDAVRAESTMIRDLERGEPREPAERRPFYFRFSWGLASLLVGVFAAGFLIYRLAISSHPETYRANAASRLELVAPRSVQSGPDSLVFRWKPVKDAEYYVIEVFDEALTPLWKSDRVSQNQSIPSAGLAGKLERGHRYFWMVTAHFPERDSLASSLLEFSVKN